MSYHGTQVVVIEIPEGLGYGSFVRQIMKRTHIRSRRRFLKASSMLGLAVAFGPATIGEAFADSRIAEREDTMTRSGATQAADKTTILPFHFDPQPEHAPEWKERTGGFP
jgi:hypothetical protein